MIDKLLEQGRVETNPTARRSTRAWPNASARSGYNLWVWYTIWAVGTQNNVQGVSGPPLPDGNGQPSALFAGAIPVVGLSLSK